MSRTIDRRILKLEDRVAPGKLPQLVVVCKAGSEDILDTDRCIQILGECGFLPTTPGIVVVKRLDMPDDLNAEELESFLRQHGAETRGFQRHAKLG